jgi:hypothetical protein
MVERNRDITQRLKYFDRQFLRVQDFVDEQDWILDRFRRHNRLLHTAGIGEGLVVSALSEVGKEKVVLVIPGTAYDNLGRELIVTTPHEVNLLDLKDATEQFISPVFLTIVYREELSEPSTDPGTANQHTRILIKPDFKISANVPTEPEPLLLAAISRDPATGTITAIDSNPSGRKRVKALPPNSVSSETLADQSVQNRHVAAGAVTSDKIAVETIQTTNLAPEIQSLLRQIPRMSSGLSIVESNTTITVTHNLGNVVIALIVGVTDLQVVGNIQEVYGNSNQSVFATVDNTAPNGTFQLTSVLPASANVRWWALALP